MILGLFIGFTLGMLVMSFFASYRLNKMENDRNNAEKRALTHFEKLMAIENTLKGIKETTDSKEKDRLLKKIKEIIERRK